MLRTPSALQTEAKAFEPCAQDRAAVMRLVASAEAKLGDAQNTSVSAGTRFEAAYDAAFCTALAALNAAGWRHRSVPGHHAFVLEGACALVDATERQFDELDALRDLRNMKYSGVERSIADVAEALRVYARFRDLVGNWLVATHPRLLR